MSCNGICIRHKAQKPQTASLGRYATGQKRCQTCDTFINWSSLWCPCCGSRLRTKSRNSAFKERLEIRARQQRREDEQVKAPLVVRY